MLGPWIPPTRSRPPPTSAHGSRRPATSPTTPWPLSRGWACGCTGHCCSRASRAPARRRWPRRWPRSSACRSIRLQCYEGIDATQALYDWDFPRQILHLRTLEAATERRGSDAEDVEQSLFDERFLLARPVLRARRASRRRAARRRGRPGRRRVRGVPARGALDLVGEHPRARHGHASTPPRRHPHLQPHPRAARRPQASLPLPLDRPPRARARGRDRAEPRARGRGRAGASRSSRLVQQLRTESLLKPPGVAETLDWARALQRLGATELDLEPAAATLGAVVKYREDTDRVKQVADRMLAG